MVRKHDNENILGIPISHLACDAIIEKILPWSNNGKPGYTVACANPHSLEVSRRDRMFKEALMTADLVIPDGIGIVWASKVLGGQIRQRVTGSDIFLELNWALNREEGRSVFFLGSTEETLSEIRRRFSFDFPNVRVAGTYSPPYSQEFSKAENRSMVEAVNEARPDVLWVGMTAPKQEKWLFRNRGKLMVGVSVAVGAVFDFYSGKVKRSSPVFQRLGLEWLPRLLREPRKLWRRNFISNPNFMRRVLVQRCALIPSSIMKIIHPANQHSAD
jgi:N-acetylglucosaminyldiphosphoundecaprenol N-acetyl-beta-D-mannosaminyltransferase